MYLAAETKKYGSIPVAILGGLNDPAQIEEIIASGKADIVYMARARLDDPELPRKVTENRDADIVRYLRCLPCMAERVATSTRRCTVNPLIGRECGGTEVLPAPTQKKVLVVGGGPSGLYAAYQGTVGVRNNSNAHLIQFNSWNYFTDWNWGNAVENEFKVSKANNNWEGISNAYQNDIDSGNMKLTVARKGTTFYIYANGADIGEKTFASKYEKMACKVAVGCTSYKGESTEIHWNYELSEDISKWTMANTNAPLQMQNYKGDPINVPNDTDVAAFDSTGRQITTAHTFDGMVVLGGRAEGEYPPQLYG